MTMLGRGLHERLITESVAHALAQLDRNLHALREQLRDAECADRIALHLAAIVRRLIESAPERGRADLSVRFAQAVLQALPAAASGMPLDCSDVAAERPTEPAHVLRAILRRQPDGQPESLVAPLLPLLDTALLTNAPGEPRVGHQVAAEVDSADRIDVVMAFIRRSGLGPLQEALARHCQRGGNLRVLTTTFTGTTECEALCALRDLGAQVRVSYDTAKTRLHAKAWLFHRDSGYSTAYVGSSNLTHAAQITGMEWNVRVARARNPDVIDKLAAVFESYWHHADFQSFDETTFRASTAQANRPREILLSPLELRPEPFQQRLLEQLALARSRGHHRNLLVSATGTGKTVMAAIDYTRLRRSLPRARLLFVAHRMEILEQSLATFRHALRQPAFGELWVAGKRPEQFDHVFASVQTLAHADLRDIEPQRFDVVIVDEFHHAAAPSYQRLLEHLRPVELLGLTATPERADGLPVLTWFEDRIAAELRLWDAIDQQHLCPFAYYGIHDGVDLRAVQWRRGQGYDLSGLSHVLTGNDQRANLILAQLRQHVPDAAQMRALGFCVSVDHARYMARVFRDAGFAAVAVWADTPAPEREQALRDLGDGRLQVLFAVDLFNEGVDLPSIDTLLLLRPTDSPTLFIQQLGRGLRRADGKLLCTVLDFVGQHRREFRFDRRLRALLGGSRKDLVRQVEQGFPFLPAGCHMQLDRVARDVVLDNLRQALPSRWQAKVEELRAIAQQGEPTLAEFLAQAGLDFADVYDGERCWADLRAAAGLPVLAAGPSEAILRRGCGRLIHIDDPLRLSFYVELLARSSPPVIASLPVTEQRLVRMLIAALADKALTKAQSLQDACDLLWAHPEVRSELSALLPLLRERMQHVGQTLTSHPHVPLRVHARYTRIEILAAFGIGQGAKVAPWQSGVYWDEAAAADLLAFTIDKTDGDFSPTTRYRDFAISPRLSLRPHPRVHVGASRRPERAAGCSIAGASSAARAWRIRHRGELQARQMRARRKDSQHLQPVSSTGRASRPPAPTAQPADAISSTRGAAAASACSRACAKAIGPSGSWGQPPTRVTSPSCRWPSPGDSNTNSRRTCSPPWPRRWRSPRLGADRRAGSWLATASDDLRHEVRQRPTASNTAGSASSPRGEATTACRTTRTLRARCARMQAASA